MSQEEQLAQHESIRNIERIQYSMNLKQIATTLIVIISFVATIVTGFWKYDNGNKAQYADKKDYLKLNEKVDNLSIVNANLIMNLGNLSQQLRNYRKLDSLNSNIIRDLVIGNKRQVDRDLQYIKKHLYIKGVIEKRMPDGTIALQNY